MIKIIAGVYGHYVGGRVVPKDSKSEPFALTTEQEARLVKMGVAAYVEPVANVPDTITDGEEEKALEEMTGKELIAKGEEYGLSFKKGTTKAVMIAAIKEAQESITDGEEAPAFDATASVVE